MSTIAELFAPRFMREGRPLAETFAEMARELGADSLRYLPVESIAKAVARPADELCRACITGRYPTPHGQKLYQIALADVRGAAGAGLTVDAYLRQRRLASSQSMWLMNFFSTYSDLRL
jgi:amidophosphoribosyltransferase